MESDRDSNTFTLTLSWLATSVDEFWYRRLGVRLTPDEARVLQICVERDGLTTQEIRVEEKLSADEAERIVGRLTSQALLIEKAHSTPREVHKWRYDKGGLLAEDITRDAVREFQQALWRYDGSRESSQAMRAARRFVLRSLRADLGLGKNVSGQWIYQIVGERQEIGKELEEIRTTTGESDS